MNEESGKKLNLLNLIGLSVGNTIGAGIFIVCGLGLALTGRSVSLAVVAGCFLMLLAYWYSFGMSMMIVFKGGDYSMKRFLLGPLLTGVMAMFTLLGAFGMSLYGIAIADCLIYLLPALAEYERLIAFVIITAVFLLTLLGSRCLTLTQNLITAALVIILGIFIACGLPKVNFAGYFSPSYDGGFFRDGRDGFLTAIAVMGYVFMGAASAPIAMSAVTKRPKRTVPMAIFCGTCFVALIYALMMVVAGGVLPYDSVAGENISVVAAAVLSSPLFTLFIIGGAICAVASTLFCTVAMYRYPMIQIAEDGWLPAIFKKQTKNGYPYVSYIALYIVSIVPIITGMSMRMIVSVIVIPFMVLNVYANMACIDMPNLFPVHWDRRSIKIPKGLFRVLCLVGTGCSLLVAYILFKELSYGEVGVCFILVLITVGLSWLRVKQGGITKDKLDALRQQVLDEALKTDDTE